MAQLLLMKADDELQLYVSPVNWKPDAPPLPISSPPAFRRRSVRAPGPLSGRSGGPRRRGRSTKAAWTNRRSWRTSTAPSTIAPRSSSTASTRATGTCSSASIESTDRVQHMMWRLHRPEASDVRRGAGREVRRLDRARLSPRRSVRRRSPRAHRPRDHGARRLRPRLPLVAQGRQPQHLAGAAGLHGAAVSGPDARREEARRPLRRRRRSGRTSTGRARGPTRWASARSTSTCAAAKAAASSAPGPRRSSWPTN